MRVGVFRGVRRIEVEEAPEPVAGERDVVIDVKACGICGSDLHTYLAGALVDEGQVLGHEFAGEVVEVGSEVTGIARGDRVTAVPIQPCGSCRRCLEGNGHLCEHTHERGIAFGLPGAFADRLRIPDARLGVNVHALPEGLSYEAGALVEPLAIAVHAVNRSGARPGRALVSGLARSASTSPRCCGPAASGPCSASISLPFAGGSRRGSGSRRGDWKRPRTASSTSSSNARERRRSCSGARGRPPARHRRDRRALRQPATIDPMVLAHKEATLSGASW